MTTKTNKEHALAIGNLLTDYKGENTLILNVSELNSWTDYFIITTINSSAHWKGLYKHVKDYTKENNLKINMPKQKSSSGDDWNLIDLGAIVVHLMSAEAREFYALEKLWHAAEKI